MVKPAAKLDWVSDDDITKITEPSAPKKLAGYIAGEKPTRQNFNWFLNLIDKWIDYFEETTDDNIADITTLNTGLAAEIVNRTAADTVLTNSKLNAPASGIGANKLVGVNAAGNASEYKTLSATLPLSITQGVGTVAIASAAASASVDGHVTTGTQTFAGNKTFNNNLVIVGNFEVQGTLVYLNTDNLQVEDKNIQFNYGGTTAGAEGGGFELLGTSNAIVSRFVYDSALSLSKWKVGPSGAEKEIVTNVFTAIGQIMYGGTSGVPTALAAGTANMVLKCNGAAAPSWSNTLNLVSISMTGTYTTTGLGSRFGGANGVATDFSTCNVLFYANSSTSYAGMGSDSSGNMFFVNGTATPKVKLFIPATTDGLTLGASGQSTAVIAVNGVVDASGHAKVGAYTAASTGPYASASFQKINLTNEEFDTNNVFDSVTNFRFLPVAGKYSISGSIAVNCTTTITFARLILYKNGVASKTLCGWVNPAGVNVPIYLSGTVLVDANGSDYFELWVTVTTSGTWNLIGGQDFAYMYAHRVA